MIERTIRVEAVKDEEAVIAELKGLLKKGLGFSFNRVGNTVQFTKGNYINNFVTLNVQDWKSKIKVSFERDLNDQLIICTEIKVWTVGQKVTYKENEYWEKFIDEIENFLKSGEFDSDTLGIESKNLQWQNVLWLILMILLIWYAWSG